MLGLDVTRAFCVGLLWALSTTVANSAESLTRGQRAFTDSDQPSDDPADEAKQLAHRLAQRAGAFRRLGEWPETLAMIEASLVLNTEQPEMRHAAVESLKRKLTDAPRAKRINQPARVATPDRVPAGAERVAFRPIKFVWSDAAGETGNLNGILGCVPAGTDVDFVWHRGLFLMKEPGSLKRIWHTDELNVSFSSACFDGRFVWTWATRHQRPPLLLVIDPVVEKVWEFTSDDGLPLVSHDNLPEGFTIQRLAATPLAPGRVCVAGFWGRSWLELVSFDPVAGKSVKVFHEANEVPDPENKDEWKNTRVIFEPTFMFTLSESAAGDEPVQRVLLGRGSPHVDVCYHPLVIDPHKLTVEPMQHTLWGCTRVNEFDIYRGAAYIVQPIAPDWSKLHLVRVGLPRIAKEPVMQDVAEGWTVFSGDHVSVVGKRWWTGSAATRELSAAGSVPWYFWNHWAASGNADVHVIEPDENQLVAVCRSSHFGLLVMTSSNARGYQTHRVDFQSSKGQ